MEKKYIEPEVSYYESDYDNTFYARHKKSSHKFEIQKGETIWTIIPFGSRDEEILDRKMYFGEGLSWISDLSKLPDWLPPLPEDSELEPVKSILWRDRLAEKAIYHTFSKYAYLHEYFQINEITKKIVYLIFKTDEYDGFYNDPHYSFVVEVVFDNKDDKLISETIVMYENYFDIPEINPSYPEKYKVSDILWTLDNRLFMNQFKIYKNNDKRAFFQIIDLPERIYEYFPEKHDWLLISNNDSRYSQLIEIFADNSIDFDKHKRDLNNSEHAGILYYKENKKHYLK